MRLHISGVNQGLLNNFFCFRGGVHSGACTSRTTQNVWYSMVSQWWYCQPAHSSRL